jgi:hypothetical protein
MRWTRSPLRAVCSTSWVSRELDTRCLSSIVPVRHRERIFRRARICFDRGNPTSRLHVVRGTLRDGLPAGHRCWRSLNDRGQYTFAQLAAMAAA